MALRPCRVTYPGLAPFETEAGTVDHAISRFKTEWCGMGATSEAFAVEWLDGQGGDDTVRSESAESPDSGAGTAPPTPSEPAAEPAPPEPAADPRDPSPPADPTPEEMGITPGDCRNLRAAGLDVRSKLRQYFLEHGTFNGVDGVGPSGTAKILAALRSWKAAHPEVD